MKKLLIVLLLTSSTAMAQPATDDKKTVGDFIKSGGFKSLCQDLKWTWGDLGINKGCFSNEYAKRNNYTLVNGKWVKS